jgi:site-specific DNA recombinase
MPAMQQPRDVIVARYSEQGEREDEHLYTDKIQLERGRAWASEQGHRVVAEFVERDISGKLPLTKRKGLLPALRMVEAGEADHIVFSYFDRMVRSLKVQLEVTERVEAAGGEVYLLDFGRLTNGSAAVRLAAHQIGSVNQYLSDIISEKVKPAHVKAVKRGVYPISKIPPGYARGPAGALVPDPEIVPIVVEAFERRDRGATYEDIRAFLRERGIERTVSGVVSMLTNKAFLGEIHFGELENLHAHTAIIDRALFERVQRRAVSSGRRAKSKRLLSRLGVLRCGTCGGRMVISTKTGNYRCNGSAAGGCSRRVAVKADRVEQMVMDAVRAYMAKAKVHGRASRRQQIRDADRAIDRADRALNDAIAQLDGLGLLGRPASQKALEKLTTALDDAHAARGRLGDAGTGKTIGPDDIDRLRDPARRLEAWRRLITDTVASVTVAPASSRRWDDDRITIEFLI